MLLYIGNKKRIVILITLLRVVEGIGPMIPSNLV